MQRRICTALRCAAFYCLNRSQRAQNLPHAKFRSGLQPAKVATAADWLANRCAIYSDRHSKTSTVPPVSRIIERPLHLNNSGS